MITVAYITLFILFIVLMIYVWWLFLKHKKNRSIVLIITMLVAGGFVFTAVVDARDMVVRSEYASEILNSQEPEYMSTWNKNIYKQEKDLLEAYQWDRQNLNLADSKNKDILADVYQNVLLFYLTDRIEAFNETKKGYKQFKEDKAQYIGKVCEVVGTSQKQTDGKELPFTEAFLSQNTSCEVEAYYCKYKDSKDKYLLLTIKPEEEMSLEENDYFYGLYGGFIELNQDTYDVFIMNG